MSEKMMKNVFRYRDVLGEFYYTPKADMLVGEVYGTASEYTFEGRSIDELKDSFKAAVDSFLESCELGKISQDKSYNGVTSIRIPSGLHREIVMWASLEDINLNQFIVNALSDAVTEKRNRIQNLK